MYQNNRNYQNGGNRGGYHNRGDNYRGHNNYRGGRGGRGGRFNDRRGGQHGSGGGRPRTGLPASMILHKENELPPQVTMAKQIVTRLGDFANFDEDENIAENIKALAATMVGAGDLDDFATDISDLFVKCFTQLSVQLSISATLLAMIYRLDKNFPALTVEKLSGRVQYALEHDDVPMAKLALRALACLAASNCVRLQGEGSVTSVLYALVAVAEGSWLEDTKLDHQGQVAAYLLAVTIPWIVSILVKAEPASEGASARELLDKAASLFEKVCVHWNSPYDVGGFQAIFHVAMAADEEEEEGAEGDGATKTITPAGPKKATCWDTLWEACNAAKNVIAQALSAEGFQAPSCMPMPWVELAEDLQEGDNEPLSIPDSLVTSIVAFGESKKIGASGRFCSPTGSAIGCGTSLWLLPRFPIFDSASNPHAAACASSLSALERTVIMGYYRDILQFFDPYLRNDGTKVGTNELLISHLLAVSRMLPEELRTESHLEYLLLETLFQLIVQQPSSATVSSGIFRVILDLAKKQQQFPPAVAYGTAILYQNLAEMDTSAAREVSRWLAYHLVNTLMAWPFWDHWAPDVSDGSTPSLARTFCASVIDHCTRGWIPEKVRAAIPEVLADLVPEDPLPVCPLFPKITAASSAAFAYEATATRDDAENEEELTALQRAARELKKMIENKASSSTVEEWLDSLNAEELQGELSGFAVQWRAQFLLQGVLAVGGSVLSGISLLADRYSEALRSLATEGEEDEEDATSTAVVTIAGTGDDAAVVPVEAGQKALMATLGECVGHDHFLFNLTLDIYLRRSIVSPSAAADWATSPTILQSLHSSYWHSLHVEVIVDRTLDIVRAAAAQRRELGGDMKMDETVDTYAPKDMSGQVTEVIPSKRGKEDADQDVDANEEEPSNKRRRRGADEEEDADYNDEDEPATTVAAAGGGADEEEEDDPVELATIAVVHALKTSRAVYAVVVGRLLTALVRREQQLAGDEEAVVDEWTVAATSLLYRVLRAFHGAEASYLSDGPENRVTTTAVSAVENALRQAEREGVVQSTEGSTAVAAWRNFTRFSAPAV